MSRKSSKPTKPESKILPHVLCDSKDYHTVMANGCFTGSNPVEVFLTFWWDIPQPQMDQQGKMALDKVIREKLVTVKIPIMNFVPFAIAIQKRLERLRQRGILKKIDEQPQEAADTSSYIG